MMFCGRIANMFNRQKAFLFDSRYKVDDYTIIAFCFCHYCSFATASVAAQTATTITASP
jgi:hypothetical protein